MEKSRLENFLSSLFYLEREAEKEGYKTISRVIKNAISTIDAFIHGCESLCLKEELGHELYNALSVVKKIQELDTKQLKILSDVIISIKPEKNVQAENRRL